MKDVQRHEEEVALFLPHHLLFQPQWISSILGGVEKEEHLSGEKGREKVQPD